jgi:tetratricopeptide (TPR) repeat protein
LDERSPARYGRELDIDRLKAELRRQPLRPVLVRGPSGIGKSELLRAVHADLIVDGREISILHSPESPAHTVHHLIEDVTRQLLVGGPLPRTDTRRLARSMIRTARDSSWSIAAAVLLDLAGKVLPGSGELAKSLAEQLSQELAETRPSAMLEQLRADAPQDLLVGLLTILKALSETGIAGTILIDQAEAASEAVREAILGMAVQLPERWGAVIAVNDELPEGIEFLDRVWPRLAYAGGSQTALGPLQADGLEEWCLEERGTAPSRLELDSVIANCQGRPLLLREWVSGTMTPAEVGHIWQRLGPYYQRRLDALRYEARSLIRALALLPAQVNFSLPLITQIMEAESTAQAFDAVEELIRAQFLEPASDEDTYRFVHDVTKRQVAGTMPRAVIRESAGRVAAALRSLEPGQEDAQWLYAVATLEYQAENYPGFVRDALPAATDLLSAGSYAPALELYRACFSLEAAHLDDAAEIEARLGMAATLYATGYYHEGLRFLEEMGEWPATAGARGLLMRARLQVRLAEFQKAQETLTSARRRFAELHDEEGVVQCDKELVTVLRDLGRYPAAVELSVQLMERAERHRVSARVMASCHRALARSLASDGLLERALVAAERALVLAQETSSATDIGNARLALGEVHRLAANPADAIAHYAAATDTALALGNRDAYLWPALGLADCHVLLGDLPSARDSLTPVAQIVRSGPDRYPLISLHWRLSDLSIAHLSGGGVAEELQQTVNAYTRLGITWPERHVRDLLATGPLAPKRFG